MDSVECGYGKDINHMIRQSLMNILKRRGSVTIMLRAQVFELIKSEILKTLKDSKIEVKESSTVSNFRRLEENEIGQVGLTNQESSRAYPK